MAKFEEVIMEIIKNQYILTSGSKSFDTDMKSEKGQFYLKNLKDNLVTEMSKEIEKKYTKGTGKELKIKMRALKSSSAMTFNIFRNNDVNILKNQWFSAGKYTVEYEKQLKTIRNSTGNQQPANIDAYLYSDEHKESIFCEMKMTEWLFNNPGKLKSAYLNKVNYFDNGSFEVFESVFKNMKDGLTNDKENYKSIFKRYDAFQMLKHALAIYNSVNPGSSKNPKSSNEVSSVKKITLLNCVWEMDDVNLIQENKRKYYTEKLEQEHNEYEIFKNKFSPIIEDFGKKGIDFQLLFLSTSQLIDILLLDEPTKKKLNRYKI